MIRCGCGSARKERETEPSVKNLQNYLFQATKAWGSQFRLHWWEGGGGIEEEQKEVRERGCELAEGSRSLGDREVVEGACGRGCLTEESVSVKFP